MALRIKVSVLLWCLCSAASAMTVLLESPPHAHVAPTAATFPAAPAPDAAAVLVAAAAPTASFVGAPAALFGAVAAAAPAAPGGDDDSAAAAASPTGNFDSFGGFSGPKALSSLVGLADFGDLDGQFDSSGFERAFAATPNRRADSGSFDDFAGLVAAVPTPHLRAIAPPSSSHYNPQQASGFNAALAAAAAAPAYGTRTVAAAPAPRPAYSPAPTAYLPAPSAYPATPVAAYPKVLKPGPGAALFRPAAAALPAPAPVYRPAPVSALPLQQPGYAAPYYPPHVAASAAYAPRAAAPGVSGTRYSALHAASRGAGGVGGGLGSSLAGTRTSSQRAAPAPQRDVDDFGGFGFGSELSGSATGGGSAAGGFDFGAEEF